MIYQKPATSRFILITQCLQNDFFLNNESSVKLPLNIVQKMLIGNAEGVCLEARNGKLVTKCGSLSDGPLGRLLTALLEPRKKEESGDGILHVVNIRDWHQSGPAYDKERVIYGPHCLKESWGADYISGLEHLLDPSRTAPATGQPKNGQFFGNSKVRVYHMYSNSVFDFRPHGDPKRGQTGILKTHPSDLETLLDVLMMGTEQEVSRLPAIFSNEVSLEEELAKLSNEARTAESSENEVIPELYVAIIGVYTDIKVRILATGLRTRYDIPNLAVSDTFTATPTLERHLNSLDYFNKVLGIEIIHGINDLSLFLGGPNRDDSDSGVVTSTPFSQFSNFVQDKQNLLAYESERTQEYLRLTEKRALSVYKKIARMNNTLFWFGVGFLLTSLASAVFSVFFSDLNIDWRIPAVTGGIGLVQVVTIFISRPMSDMQRNLTNLATFRMILENHSMKAALARFHLTTPQLLTEKVNMERANGQIDVLKAQLAALKEIESDFTLLEKLGFGAGTSPKAVKSMMDKVDAAGA